MTRFCQDLAHFYEFLAVNVILDTETRDPTSSWPRLASVTAAEDFEGAIRGISPMCDPTSLGPGRLRRMITMRT